MKQMPVPVARTLRIDSGQLDTLGLEPVRVFGLPPRPDLLEQLRAPTFVLEGLAFGC
jgi:hypothetical protein